MSSLLCIRERLKEAACIIADLQRTVERMISEEQESTIRPLSLDFDADRPTTIISNLDNGNRTNWSESETSSFRRLIGEGRSYSEIAQILGKTIQQVRDKKKTEIRSRRI
jgi:hypothetical protein